MNIEDTLKLAIKCHNAHNLENATRLYNRILTLDADHSDANHLSGLISLFVGNADEAEEKILRAIKASPEEAIYYNSLGNVFKTKNKNKEAEYAYFSALEINPRLHEPHHNLGKLFEKINNLDNAKYHLIEAISLNPTSFESTFSLARILIKLAKFPEAVNFFHKASIIEPGNAEVFNGLAFALEKAGRLDDSIQFFEKSLALKPNEVATLSNLGHALLSSGRAVEAVNYFKKGLEIQPDNQFIWDRYLFSLVFSESSNRKSIFKENKRWAAKIENKISKLVDFSNHYVNPNKKIKIGYYSKEFYSHVTSFFFETLLKYHNREFFEIHCYSDCIKPDKTTAYLQKKSNFWWDVSQLEPDQIAQKIRNDHIDIFVGTTNFLSSNRIVSAHQPAPIIVSYMNQISSTGLSKVDYLITDDQISPASISDNFFTERLIRLPDFICYCPPEIEVSVEPPPVLKNGYVTFGCFNNLAKINQNVVTKWSDILLSVSNSRMRLMAGGFNDKTMQARYLKLFVDCGIDQDRIDFVATIPGREEYLSQYNLIDIALDTFPFTGGTVTDEAIYMSVPLVSLAGNIEMGCMSKSKLYRLNLYELIADSVEDYVQIAVDLANNIGKIKKFNTDIRDIALETIFNGKYHVNNLEDAYRQMWKDYCVQNSG
jgi:protein O-GlcNAc transferase